MSGRDEGRLAGGAERWLGFARTSHRGERTAARLSGLPPGYVRRSKMARVFISYAREDQPVPLRLYHDLERCGHEPWIDRYHIRPGEV